MLYQRNVVENLTKTKVEEVKLKKEGEARRNFQAQSLQFSTSEEAVILHLNIKNNKESDLNIEDEFVKYNPSINIPTPFIPDDLENAFYLKDQVPQAQNIQFKQEDLNTSVEIREKDDLNNETEEDICTIDKTIMNENFEANNLKMNINIEEQFNTKNREPI